MKADLLLARQPSAGAPAYQSPYFHFSGHDFSKVRCPVAEKAFDEEAVGFHGSYMLIGGREDMDDIVDAIIKIQENADEAS